MEKNLLMESLTQNMFAIQRMERKFINLSYKKAGLSPAIFFIVLI